MSNKFKYKKSNSITQNKWIAVYLFHTYPLDNFLTDIIKPFINKTTQNHLAEKFFFIRYFENGHHIRLRFKCKNELNIRYLKNLIKEYFSSYYNSHMEAKIINSSFPNRTSGLDFIEFMDYVPEFKRYGGEVGMKIAENQFQSSSEVVLETMTFNKNWNYQKALGNAFILNLCLTYAFKMNKNKMILLFDTFFRSIIKTFGLSEHIFDINTELGNKFRNYILKFKPYLIPICKDITTKLTENCSFEEFHLNKWVSNMKHVYSDLSDAYFAKSLDISKETFYISDEKLIYEDYPIWPIYMSYIHMNNNRLGISNLDEAFLSYLLYDCLSSK